MCKVRQLLIFLSCLFTLTNSTNVSSCISNTPCKCLLTEDSFTLLNCSYSLPDLPLFNSNTSLNITKIIARHALIRWPLHLCGYSNIEILDLSGSYLDAQYMDLSCVSQLLFLNLSNTQIRKIPNFRRYGLKNLQTLDLSNNQIEILDGSLLRSLNNLVTLNVENNPLKYIDYFDYILGLSSLESINLMSSSSTLTTKKQLSAIQWANLAHKWNSSNKYISIRTNTFSLQSIFPNPDQFQMIPLDLMKIIFQTLSNSTFTTLFSTPSCNCVHLRNYQRVFSFTYYNKNLSPLYQTTTCILPNGIIHARLFDYRTFF
ncbi:unnamed protein product [Rotaria socialis]|uniref:Uncharacterized protein n=1 Tax=Rotaria socialis TaxID=392032 RepID=A0A818RER1_9BILA|nr:unnamed protein product [Rotaria socialis]CAF3652658.1 unnamed protein product [Rotaria socialis]